jgi:acetyltransferase-like isoleucine patch superfamily enzyme
MRKVLFSVLTPLYLGAIFGLPLAACASLYLVSANALMRLTAIAVTPVLFSICFVGIAAALSLAHQGAIVPGRFPRSVAHPVYFHRRLYGLCWTSVYYFTPVYFLTLSIPFLKKLVFRGFGYKGEMDFTTYPDTWIRDLPLLKIGRGAYLSNKATIGTNIAFPDGSILVDSVTVGDGALIGHLAMLAPGVEVRKGAEVGVGAAIGLKSVVGEQARINAHCGIEHGVKIGARVKIGATTYVSSGVEIAPDISIPPGITIPSRMRITSQDEAGLFAHHIADAKRKKKLGKKSTETLLGLTIAVAGHGLGDSEKGIVSGATRLE